MGRGQELRGAGRVRPLARDCPVLSAMRPHAPSPLKTSVFLPSSLNPRGPAVSGVACPVTSLTVGSSEAGTRCPFPSSGSPGWAPGEWGVYAHQGSHSRGACRRRELGQCFSFLSPPRDLVVGNHSSLGPEPGFKLRSL